MMKGAYSNCLWTGFANKVYIGSAKVDMSVQYDDEKKIVPVMPASLWENEDEFVALYTAVDNEKTNYLPASLIRRLKITMFP